MPKRDHDTMDPPVSLSDLARLQKENELLQEKRDNMLTRAQNILLQYLSLRGITPDVSARNDTNSSSNANPNQS